MTDFLSDPSILAVSVGIVLLSFLSEDAAAVSSALLVLGGPVAWPVGFASCFLGIWLGDLTIYFAARWGGRPFLRSRWLAQRVNFDAVDRLEAKFARHAGATLFVSRFLPGTRVVTYVAAGLFSTPPGRFARMSGVAVLVWVAGIFLLTKVVGTSILVWFGGWPNRVAVAVMILLGLSGVFWLLRRGSLPTVVRRWARWEFWPAWLFYLPVAFYYVWLGLRYRSFTLPSAANPGIPTGGLIGESKCAILAALHEVNPDLVADAYPLVGLTTAQRVLALKEILRDHNITMPFILKPDVGQRGAGVKLIRSLDAAFDYLTQVDAPVIVQRYAPGPCEIGVFYYRFPNEPRGRIFALTEKIFPVLTGDGTRTIEELIHADPRASMMAEKYLERFALRRGEVLPAGTELKLVESGNHAQGCIFRDGRHLWSPELEDAIDRLSNIPGFFIGRYDIRYAAEEDLRAGNFQVVELNGAASEATNIYDSRNSLGGAYRTLFAQWRLVFAIGAANRARGAVSSSLLALWQEWRKYCRAASSYPVAD